jgi:hypothetical protein
LCKSNNIGDEINFLLSCKTLIPEREKYLTLNPSQPLDATLYTKILSTKDDDKLASLAKYAYKGLDKYLK